MKKPANTSPLLAVALLGLAIGIPATSHANEIITPLVNTQAVYYGGATIQQPAVIHMADGTNAFGTRYSTATLAVTPVAYAPTPAPIAVPVAVAAWQPAGISHIPSRFGDLNITAENMGSIWRFAVVLNNQVLLRAENQPGALQVSGVYELDGEDAIVITAMRGEAACPFRSYLVTVRSDGFVAGPRELDSCSNMPQSSIVNRALFINFSNSGEFGGISRWDVWRYENSELVRL